MGEYLRIINEIKILIALAILLVPIYLLNANTDKVVTTPTLEEVMETVPISTLSDEEIEEMRVNRMSPVELVEHFSEKYEVNPVLAKAIIKCESGVYSSGLNDIQDYQRTIKTQIPNVVSSAESYFMFLDGTWRYTMQRMGLPTDTPKTHEIMSIEAGVWLLSRDGVRHWEESRSCWQRLIH